VPPAPRTHVAFPRSTPDANGLAAAMLHVRSHHNRLANAHRDYDALLDDERDVRNEEVVRLPVDVEECVDHDLHARLIVLQVEDALR